MVCCVIFRLHLRVPQDVETSPEWQRRVTTDLEAPAMGFGADWRRPRRWNWRKALVDRANMLAKGSPVSMLTASEVARSPTSGEVRWAEVFYRRAQDDAWCLSLGRFDEPSLDGLPAFAPGGETSPDRCVYRDVLRWRHGLQGLFLQ